MKKAVLLLLVSIVGLPVQAENVNRTNINSIQSYLSGLAIRNGQVSTNHSYVRVLSGQQQVPTQTQTLQTIHNLPKPSQIPVFNDVIADPTPEELNFILPGATDGDGNPLPDPIPGLLFGSILPKSTDSYGIDRYDDDSIGKFDDLSNAIIPDPLIVPEGPDYDTQAIDPTPAEEQGYMIPVTNPAYCQYLKDMQSKAEADDAQAAIDAAAQEATNQIIPDQTIIYTPISQACVPIKCTIPKKAVVEVTKSVVRSYTDPIYISIGIDTIKLHPGQELCMSEFKRDGIARRNLTPIKLSCGKDVLVSEFHIISALKGSDLKKGKELNRILKTAAALQIATRLHGRYCQ